MILSADTGQSANAPLDAEWLHREAELLAAVAQLRRMIEREMGSAVPVAQNDNAVPTVGVAL
jgi:hypothetical protein